MHHVPSGLMHLKVVTSQERGSQQCCVAVQSAPSVLGSVQTAPADEVVKVTEAEGTVAVDCAGETKAPDEVDAAKISAAEVHGQTVMVDSTVTVTMAVALRAKSPVARIAWENCILSEVDKLRYCVQTVRLVS